MLSEGDIKKLSKSQFGKDFHWGISTSAYQVEGAYNADGKGMSIWDVFSSIKGKVKDGHSGKNACEFYYRYPTDLDLLQSLNINNFRFSLSWSRILPKGTGSVNHAGMDFYDRLADECLSRNITPWITLYHWDLPHHLELKGGWTNRDILMWFGEYVRICAEKLGDRVKNWIVLNEPMVFTGAGYFLGVHAPGRRGPANFLPALHHAVLCQAEGGRILRESVTDANIGTTFSCSHIDPYRNNNRDKRAAEKVDALLNRMFLEPTLGLSYPIKDLPMLRKLDKYILNGDEAKMVFDFDFIGLQNYTREIVKYSLLTPLIRASIVPADKRKVPHTMMNWEIYPEALYQILKKFSSYKQIKQIIITENGIALPDQIENELIIDTSRIEFLQSHLHSVLRALKHNNKIKGYFHWSLLDNLEWSEGYHPRFGIVYVNFQTQKRIIKESGKWFANFLSDSFSEDP